MNKKTDTFIKTFPNTVEGQSDYRQMVLKIRKHLNGGRFVKMYRQGIRHGSSGSTIREGSKSFQVYFLPTYKSIGRSEYDPNTQLFINNVNVPRTLTWEERHKIVTDHLNLVKSLV